MNDRILFEEKHDDELHWLRDMVCGRCGFGPVPIAVLFPIGRCKQCGVKDWRPA